MPFITCSSLSFPASPPSPLSFHCVLVKQFLPSTLVPCCLLVPSNQYFSCYGVSLNEFSLHLNSRKTRAASSLLFSLASSGTFWDGTLFYLASQARNQGIEGGIFFFFTFPSQTPIESHSPPFYWNLSTALHSHDAIGHSHHHCWPGHSHDTS